jgi:ubiquitin-protein ligase
MFVGTHLPPDCKGDKSSSIRIDLIDNSPFHLKGSFPGPKDTPYEGGTFEVVSASTASPVD